MSRISKKGLDLTNKKNVLIIEERNLVESRVGTSCLPRGDDMLWDCEVKIMSMDDDNMEIDFIGFDSSIVNAFRRIIFTEVPTVAIDTIHVFYNTSVVPDELLGSRLGLIQVNVHPSLLQDKDPEDECTSKNSIRYNLKVICKNNVPVGTKHKEATTVHHTVLSSNLKYISVEGQSEIFGDRDFRPLHEDLPIAALNAGQEIDIEVYATKGVGRDHAKFSPAHCYYRLLPLIEITELVEGERARRLQSCFSKGVISVVNKKGKEIAKVENPRIDSSSRNILLQKDLKDSVIMGRKSDHFIFYIESQSCLKSDEILVDSIDVLIGKCDVLLSALNKGMDVEMKE